MEIEIDKETEQRSKWRNDAAQLMLAQLIHFTSDFHEIYAILGNAYLKSFELNRFTSKQVKEILTAMSKAYSKNHPD